MSSFVCTDLTVSDRVHHALTCINLCGAERTGQATQRRDRVVENPTKQPLHALDNGRL